MMLKPKFILSAFFILAFSIACKTKKNTAVKATPIDTRDEIRKADEAPIGTIKITGATKKIDGAIVYITATNSRQKIWIDTIRKNKFEATLPVERPGFYTILFEGKYPPGSTPQGWLHWYDIYLENDHTYHIVAGTDIDILHNHSVFTSNSTIQNQLFEFYKNFWEQTDKGLNEVYNKSMRAKELSGNKAAYKKLTAEVPKDDDSVRTILPNMILKFARENPNTIVATHELLTITDVELKRRYADYNAAYDNLSPNIKVQNEGLLFKERLQKLKPGQN